ncbi:hypothetical protein [Methanoregula sp.]|uniref:hypothetical protein n=1 Tax=Methanoregula sp. TaxID=2052170 RepID=UPI003BAF7960
MDNLRIVPAAKYPAEAIRNLNPANAVSVAEHPVTISPMNDSRFIPAIPAVSGQYVITLIPIRSPLPEDIFISLNGRGDGGEADRRRSP